jgi:hypothetical protein
MLLPMPLLLALSTVNCQLPTVNCQLPTANCQLSTVNCQLSTANCQLSTATVTVDVAVSTVSWQLSLTPLISLSLSLPLPLYVGAISGIKMTALTYYIHLCNLPHCHTATLHCHTTLSGTKMTALILSIHLCHSPHFQLPPATATATLLPHIPIWYQNDRTDPIYPIVAISPRPTANCHATTPLFGIKMTALIQSIPSSHLPRCHTCHTAATHPYLVSK